MTQTTTLSPIRSAAETAARHGAARDAALHVAPLTALPDPSRAEDLEVELLMSTHLTIVVRARVELDGGGDVQDTGLVIARSRCRGDQPSRRALLDAARECAARMASGAGRAPQGVRRLLARINGRWQSLFDVDTVLRTEAA